MCFLCDKTPYNPIKINRYFGGTYRLHYMGRIISQLKSSRKYILPAVFLLLVSCFDHPSILNMKVICSPKHLDFFEINRVVIQKDTLYLMSIVRTLNPAQSEGVRRGC
jgi:hypothetical protein